MTATTETTTAECINSTVGTAQETTETMKATESMSATAEKEPDHVTAQHPAPRTTVVITDSDIDAELDAIQIFLDPDEQEDEEEEEEEEEEGTETRFDKDWSGFMRDCKRCEIMFMFGNGGERVGKEVWGLCDDCIEELRIQKMPIVEEEG